MPHPVLRIPRPRLGQVAPLAQRWAELDERLLELPPSHPARGAGNRCRTEEGYDDALAEYHRAKAELAAAPPDPLVSAAASELYEYRRQWNACAINIKTSQAWLSQKVSDWKFRLMGALHADMFVVPQVLSTSVSERPTEQLDQATKELSQARRDTAKVRVDAIAERDRILQEAHVEADGFLRGVQSAVAAAASMIKHKEN
jgi:hypothetical protein